MVEKLVTYDIFESRGHGTRIDQVVPTHWIDRFLSWLVGKRGHVLAHHFDIETDKFTRAEIVGSLSVPEAVRALTTQINWAKKNNYKPTKLICGPDQIHAIEHNYFKSYSLPSGLPMLGGLELVVNPCIDGIAIG